MEKRQLPADFDWVTARQKCSVGKFFERLRIGAEKNMQARNALREERGERFHFESTSDANVCSVIRPLRGGIVVVRFVLDGERIRVEGSGVDVNFEGTLTLNHEAECRLKVAGQELDEWQVLRLGLEALFFDL